MATRSLLALVSALGAALVPADSRADDVGAPSCPVFHPVEAIDWQAPAGAQPPPIDVRPHEELAAATFALG